MIELPNPPKVVQFDEIAGRAKDLGIKDTPGPLEQKIKAKYKIEVHFGPKRTPNGPNNALICLWESGKHLHGGGDEKLYLCMSIKGSEGCGGFISGTSIHNGIAICPSCKAAINAENLTDVLVWRDKTAITTKELASVLAKLFRKMNFSADIYCKYSPEDWRYLICEKKYGSERARYLRGLLIYSLERILKDTAAGSSLEARFAALLSS